MVIKTAKEKESMVIKMLNDGYNSRQITHACQVSSNFVVAIRKKLTGERPSEPMHIKAYRLFETKGPYQVAIDLGLTHREVSKYYSEYRNLKDLDDLSWLYGTLGHKTITELKSLHRALTRNGITPAQYATFIGKANKIDNLILEEEKLMKQNLNTRAHSSDLEQENERLLWENEDLEQTNEELDADKRQLKYEKKVLETAVSKDLVEINNLEKQKGMIINDICILQKKLDEIASEKKQLEVSLEMCRINTQSFVRELIEDIELYVIEAIIESAGLKMGNYTVGELLDDPDYFKAVLRSFLKEPLSIENLESLMHSQ